MILNVEVTTQQIRKLMALRASDPDGYECLCGLFQKITDASIENLIDCSPETALFYQGAINSTRGLLEILTDLSAYADEGS